MSVTYRRPSGIGGPRIFSPGGQLSESILALILAMGIGFGAIAGQAVTIARFAVGGVGALLFFLIATTGRVTALRLLVIWLVFLGLIRRLLIPFAGWSPEDPLLLVAPACAVMIWMNGRKESPPTRDAITFFGLLFLIWGAGQILNPLQGSMLIGAKGALYWIPPLLWLFVGRTFSIETHKKIGKVVMFCAIPVAIHGLYHNMVGLFSFEYTWVGVSGFGASIFLDGFRIRAFSSLSSPHEYGVFLAIAECFVWGRILLERRYRGWLVLLLAFLITAHFLQGTRSTFALTVLMYFVTTMLWSKSVATKMLLVGLAVALVGTIQNDMLPEEYGDGGVATAVEHMVSGFQRPEDSTASLHTSMIQDGFETAWEHPLGLGTGITTRANEKAGNFGGTTEADIANVFVSFGIPVGIFYLFFLMILFVTAVRRFVLTRTAYSLASLGCLIVVFGNMWNGGLYAVAAIVWMTIGGMSRPIMEEITIEQEQERTRDNPVHGPVPAYAPA